MYEVQEEDIEASDILESVPQGLYRRNTFLVMGEGGRWHKADLYRVADLSGSSGQAEQEAAWGGGSLVVRASVLTCAQSRLAVEDSCVGILGFEAFHVQFDHSAAATRPLIRRSLGGSVRCFLHDKKS